MIYYIYEPEYDGLTVFETEKEWLEAIDNYDFLGKFCDDGWSEYVWNVTAGKAPKEWCEDDYNDDNYIEESEYYKQHATHIVDEFLISERPADEKINEEGFGIEDGHYWGDFVKICGYTFVEKGETP